MGEFHYIGTEVLEAKARAALKAAVTESAEDLVGKAQAVTPVDTGTLKSSIHVDSVSGAGSNGMTATYTATVATGGESSEYAIYVHEGTSRGMPSFKYLEGPLIDNRPVYVEAIARAARGEF
jgi:hypothetical protein